MLGKLALGAIWGYQRFISPYKGFRCAHAVRHGGAGCSGYAKHAIRDHGLWGAIPAIRQRLRDCRAAYEALRAECTCRANAHDESEREKVQRIRGRNARKKQNRSDYCNCADCTGASIGGCGGPGRAAATNKGCDINPCDGDVGIGGFDCASCDCGGCSCG